MDIVQIIGFAAGVLTALSQLPQLIKIIREKKTEAISVWMLAVLMSGVALWAVYGFLINDLPIIITNLVSLVLNIIITVLRIKYRKPGENLNS